VKGRGELPALLLDREVHRKHMSAEVHNRDVHPQADPTKPELNGRDTNEARFALWKEKGRRW
jgi:hypothetical protein